MAGEFKFPDEQDETVVVSQQEDGDVEIEIVDDTPERDKGRSLGSRSHAKRALAATPAHADVCGSSEPSAQSQ
jgi:hypothetical protein